MVWVARHADAAGWPLPPPTLEDLADAALAKREGGAPRVLRRRLLRALIGRLHDLHPDTIAFTRDTAGAPAWEGAHIATAGCEGWSAVGVARDPIGVDIEATRNDRSVDLERWVLVEAYTKALGRGLVIAPATIAVERRAGSEARRLRACGPAMLAERIGAGEGWLRGPEAGIIAAAVLVWPINPPFSEAPSELSALRQ